MGIADGRWLGLAWDGVRLILLAYGGYLLLVFSLQRSIVFPGAAAGAPGHGSSSPPPGVERVWLEASFGRVEAWLLDAGADAPVALFAHGNGELIDDWTTPMERLRQGGVSVLLVEYPGYGRSDGRPSRGAIAEVFEVAYDQVSGLRPSVPVIGIGRSLGGGAVADLALARPLDALVLMSTLSSATEVAWGSFLVPPWLVRDRFDVRSAVAAYDGPVLLMHGTRDEVLPYANAVRIASARPGLDVVPMACGHNDCLSVWPETVEEVLTFLQAEGMLP